MPLSDWVSSEFVDDGTPSHWEARTATADHGDDSVGPAPPAPDQTSAINAAALKATAVVTDGGEERSRHELHAMSRHESFVDPEVERVTQDDPASRVAVDALAANLASP